VPAATGCQTTAPQLQSPNCVSPLHTRAPLGEQLVPIAVPVLGAGAGAGAGTGTLEGRAGAEGLADAMRDGFVATVLDGVGGEVAEVMVTVVWSVEAAVGGVGAAGSGVGAGVCERTGVGAGSSTGGLAGNCTGGWGGVPLLPEGAPPHRGMEGPSPPFVTYLPGFAKM
jgi:hypothetical protein